MIIFKNEEVVGCLYIHKAYNVLWPSQETYFLHFPSLASSTMQQQHAYLP